MNDEYEDEYEIDDDGDPDVDYDDEFVCPRCDEEFDPELHEMVRCPACGEECCTQYCHSGKEDRWCHDCEDEDDDLHDWVEEYENP